jgi:uncharacterized membrane protein YeaQ/YmgE (transglycosylase-associated protein family)
MPPFFDQLRHLNSEGALAHRSVTPPIRRAARRGEAAMLESYSWLWWIIIGGIAGAIAKLLMPGKDPGGCLITILLGIAGAFVAGWLGQAVGWYERGEGAGFIAAIVGAFILLALYRLISRRRV